MKKPKKPAIPTAPFIPSAPEQEITAWGQVPLFSLLKREKLSIADFSMKVRVALSDQKLDPSTPISFNVDQNADSYYDKFDAIVVNAEVERKVPDPSYPRRLKEWQKNAKFYAKQQADYETALVEYQEKLVKYHKDMDDYNMWDRQTEIERLKTRFEQLKKGELP